MSEFGPEFDERAAGICGLYLDAPRNAIVLSIDEKTGIQAKGLARPDTLPAPGRPPRRDNEYLRNGAQDLFAALAVRIPRQAEHPFHAKPNSHSTPSRTVIPRQAEHFLSSAWNR